APPDLVGDQGCVDGVTAPELLGFDDESLSWLTPEAYDIIDTVREIMGARGHGLSAPRSGYARPTTRPCVSFGTSKTLLVSDRVGRFHPIERTRPCAPKSPSTCLYPTLPRIPVQASSA